MQRISRLLFRLYRERGNGEGPMEKSAFERIYDIVNQIPEGKVASYGQVAGLAGNRRWARVVGYALHAIPKDKIGRASCRERV